MKTYIGVKVIEAEPQIEKLSPEQIASHMPARDGYAVQYGDGYRSWSPKDVFEEAYVEVPADRAEHLLDQTRKYLDDCAGHAEIGGDV